MLLKAKFVHVPWRFPFLPQKITQGNAQTRTDKNSDAQENSSVYFQTILTETRKGSPVHWLQCDGLWKGLLKNRKNKISPLLPCHSTFTEWMSFDYKHHTLNDDAWKFCIQSWKYKWHSLSQHPRNFYWVLGITLGTKEIVMERYLNIYLQGT